MCNLLVRMRKIQKTSLVLTARKFSPKHAGARSSLCRKLKAISNPKSPQATGDADRFRSIYDAYLKGKDVTKERIYIETMEDVLSNAEKIIMDNETSRTGVVPYLPLEQMKK